jgi:hypothetical protein
VLLPGLDTHKKSAHIPCRASSALTEEDVTLRHCSGPVLRLEPAPASEVAILIIARSSRVPEVSPALSLSTGPGRWAGIEIRHLLALSAIARTGSFHGAALQLGYTQSTISEQIAALEHTVHARLPDRPGGQGR